MATVEVTSTHSLLGVCICSVCLAHISMTFEPTGDRCALLLVGMAHAFGKVGHVQQSVRRMAKHMLKELLEVTEVSNTSLNARIRWFLKIAIHQPLLSCTHRSYRRLHRVVAVLWLSVFASVFPHSHHSFLSFQHHAIIRPLALLQCNNLHNFL